MTGVASLVAQQQTGGNVTFLISLALMVAIFYFLLIRPQQKKHREQRDMLRALKTGDQVVTIGGIYGTVVDIDETKVKLKIAENVKIDVAQTSIASRLGWEGEKKGKEGS